MTLKIINKDYPPGKEYPLHEIIFFDTGMEFNAIYNNYNKLRILLSSNKYKELNITLKCIYPEIPFREKMLNITVHKRNGTIGHGYKWCGGMCRWGTTEKIVAIDKYCNGKNAKDYVGLAFDETARLAKERKPHKLFPLAEWEMIEKTCLEYCYASGWDWLEKTDSIYDVPDYVDLYSILDRVSCWCCRNKNLKELKNIYYYFTNSYWQQLKELQSQIPDMPMKQSGNVFELEDRFRREIEKERPIHFINHSSISSHFYKQ